MTTTMTLHEVQIAGRRLGRHVRHDPKSWAYPAPMAGELKSVRHVRHVPIWDQGEVGSCTGNASVGCVSTGPFTHAGTEAEAVSVYSDATKIDGVAGSYPPNDTGSSGLAVMKVLKRRGIIKSYAHAFSLKSTLRALVLRPGITGITWLTGCDSPDAHGVVRYAGQVRGGHEIAVVGVDLDKQLVWFDNSWGPAWGLDGSFAMRIDDYAKALADHGDATFPVA